MKNEANGQRGTKEPKWRRNGRITRRKRSKRKETIWNEKVEKSEERN